MAIDINDNLAEAHYYLGTLVAGGRKINEDGTYQKILEKLELKYDSSL